MILLIFMFVVILGIVFSVVAVFTRPTKQQNELERRLRVAVGAEGVLGSRAIALPTHLEVTQPSSFKRIDAMIADTRVSRFLQILLVQGQVQTTAGAIVVMSAGGAVAAFLLVWLITSTPLAALPVALAAAYGPVAYLQFKRSRRVAAFNEALPDCIEMCARSLRVGNSIVAAIDIIANESKEPARTEFAEVFKKQNYGLPLRDALLQMLDRVPSMDLQVFVTGILVQKDTGGNLAEILDRIVNVIRERLRIKREVQTHTAQGRLTGWILCLLPIFMLIMINVTNPGYSDVLFKEELGHKMLGGGACLLAFGAFLIRRIVNGIEV